MRNGKSFSEVAVACILYHTDTDSAYDADAKMKKAKEQIRFLYLGMSIKKRGIWSSQDTKCE